MYTNMSFYRTTSHPSNFFTLMYTIWWRGLNLSSYNNYISMHLTRSLLVPGSIVQPHKVLLTSGLNLRVTGQRPRGPDTAPPMSDGRWVEPRDPTHRLPQSRAGTRGQVKETGDRFGYSTQEPFTHPRDEPLSRGECKTGRERDKMVCTNC